jgi:hypothetical protein
MNLVCLQSTIVSYLHCPGSGVFLIKNYKRYLHIYGIALTPMGRALLLLKSKSDANISVRDLQPGIVCNIHEPTQAVSCMQNIVAKIIPMGLYSARGDDSTAQSTENDLSDAISGNRSGMLAYSILHNFAQLSNLHSGCEADDKCGARNAGREANTSSSRNQTGTRCSQALGILWGNDLSWLGYSRSTACVDRWQSRQWEMQSITSLTRPKQ